MNRVNKLLDKYYMDSSDRKMFLNIITPIVSHEEFQKRLDNKLFPHHDKVSLGEHIISVAIVSYIKAKHKYKDKDKELIEMCTIIAMFHDLYELPWQNSKIHKNNFFNKHGFVHPIESIINAITWYPEHFKDTEKAKVIIDAVIHHMYPFPSRVIDKDIETLELNNYEKFYYLDKPIQDIIISSSRRHKLGNISFCKSYYKLGDIVSSSDKRVAYLNDLKLKKIFTLVTGVNKDLEN